MQATSRNRKQKKQLQSQNKPKPNTVGLAQEKTTAKNKKL